jgi:hypothetical protein
MYKKILLGKNLKCSEQIKDVQNWSSLLGIGIEANASGIGIPASQSSTEAFR